MKILPFTQAFHRLLFLWQYKSRFKSGGERRKHSLLAFKNDVDPEYYERGLNLVLDQGDLEH